MYRVFRGALMNKFNDRGYKMLFSHPRMVEDLIDVFVKEGFKDREADI